MSSENGELGGDAARIQKYIINFEYEIHVVVYKLVAYYKMHPETGMNIKYAIFIY